MSGRLFIMIVFDVCTIFDSQLVLPNSMMDDQSQFGIFLSLVSTYMRECF